MNTHKNEEALLIDSALGELEEAQAATVAHRLAKDEPFQKRHRDVQNALKALDLLPECEPPGDLAQKTLKRIAQARQTDALIAREELGRSNPLSTFTMRELFGVAACLLMILVVSVPSIRQSRRVNDISQCASQIGQIGTAMVAYGNSNNDQLPTAATEADRWLPGERAVSNSSALFRLVRGGYAGQMSFVCPASESAQPFVVTRNMTDFPGAGNVHYSYQHSLSRPLSWSDPKVAASAGRMAILADATPFYREGRFDTSGGSVSSNHASTGQNILYLDGHVGWARLSQAGLNGNHIYLAEGIYDYRGDETPVSATDSFLLPSYGKQK